MEEKGNVNAATNNPNFERYTLKIIASAIIYMSQKPVTIKEIAKQLKVSVSTVSRALHDHPSIGLRTKMQVQKLAAELNYEPNQAAISFKQGKTRTIGVVLPNLGEEFFSMAINGIEDVATQNGYTVLIGQSRDDFEREKQLIETMRKHRIDGLIASLSKDTVTYDHFRQLDSYNIPVVFFDRVPPTTEQAYSVSCDLLASSSLLVNWLVKQGHSRIGLINGPTSMQSTNERLNGYNQGLKENDLPVVPSYVINTDLSVSSTKEAMRKLLDQKNPPKAILVFNDYVALEAIKYAREAGKKINKDIFFVSYANLPITNYLDMPPLASIEQFPYKQAESATSMLLDLINGDEANLKSRERVVMNSELVVHS